MASLRIKDLHSVYQSVSQEEAIAIANLGAQTYLAAKEGFFDFWNAAQSTEEVAKADVWRREGGQAMMESLKSRLATGEAAQARMLVLQASVEAEVESRMKGMLVSARKDFELEKMDEIHVLEKKLAELKGKEHAYKLIDDAHTSMKHTIETLQKEVAKYKEATSTKSSYALGKIGEMELYDMLVKYVLPQFQYTEIKDMTGVKHMGDFHVWIVGPNLKHVKLLIDSKKYSSPVQQCEIEKLYSDVDSDETIDVGLLVSLDTSISTKSQFQITKTKKNKPCMFLSFEKLDDGIRQEVLCWAMRTLVSIAAIQDTGKRDTLMEEVEGFLKELDTTVADMDVCIKSAKSVYDLLRDVKERMVKRIHTCRVNWGMEQTKDTITHAEVAVDARCKGKVKNGERCKSTRKGESDYCGRHGVEDTDVVGK